MSYNEVLEKEGFIHDKKVAQGVNALRGALLECSRKELVLFVRGHGIRERIESQAKANGVEDPFAKLDPQETSVEEIFEPKIADKFTRVGGWNIAKMANWTETDMIHDLKLSRREVREVAIVLRLFGVDLRN